MADDKVVDSSSTGEAPDFLDTLNEKGRLDWLRNGTPQPKDEADPAPAKEETPSSEPIQAEPIAPATDTGERVQETRAERRKGQLSAEIAELLRRRAQLRAEVDGAAPKKTADQTADSAPAAAAAAPPPADGRPVPPDPAKWTGTWEELEAAKIKYFDEMVEWRMNAPLRERQAAERSEQEATAKAANDSWQERRSAAMEADPEYQSADDIVGRFFTARGVAPMIIESEVGPELVMHFYRLPKDEQVRVSKLSPAKLAREIHRVEDAILGAPPAEEEPKPLPSPKPKITSAARRPATELSGKSAGNTVDDAEAAIAAGDTAAYQRIMNARDVARRRR
jgi:hypothetical protein